MMQGVFLIPETVRYIIRTDLKATLTTGMILVASSIMPTNYKDHKQELLVEC